MINVPIWMICLWFALFAMNEWVARRDRKRRLAAEEKFMRARRCLLQTHESLKRGEPGMALDQILEAWADIALLEDGK